MARIIFVYPDHENLGIQYLMAIALTKGHSVDLAFYRTGDSSQSEQYEVTSLIDIFGNVYGEDNSRSVSFENIAISIVNKNPDLVAFSCVTDNYQKQLGIARALKKIRPGLITIFGGIHVTAVPQRVLERSEVDCIAIGEAEISFLDFLDKGSTANGFALPGVPVKGIVYKYHGKLIGKFEEGELIDLDRLPLPHKKPWMPYLYKTYMSSDYKFMTSRGCPYSCSYCINSFLKSLRGHHILRQKSVKLLISELSTVLTENPEIQTFHFWDDCFTMNAKWLSEFCERYKKEITRPFQCLAIPETATPSIISHLKEAGCYAVHIGVESTCPSINTSILKRRFNGEAISEVIRQFREAGIQIFADHILGIPGDTVTKEERSVLFYNKCRPTRILVYWLTYYPKTAIVDIARQREEITDADIEEIEEGCRGGGWYGMSIGYKVQKNRGAYAAICFILRWLPILPQWLVTVLIHSKLYRLFKIKNYAISTILPDYVQRCGGVLATLSTELSRLHKVGVPKRIRNKELVTLVRSCGMDPAVYDYTWRNLFRARSLNEQYGSEPAFLQVDERERLLRHIDQDIESAFRSSNRVMRHRSAIKLSRPMFFGIGWAEVASDPYGHVWRWIGPQNRSSVFIFILKVFDYFLETHVHTVLNGDLAKLKVQVNDRPVEQQEMAESNGIFYHRCFLPKSEILASKGRVKISFLVVQDTDKETVPSMQISEPPSCRIGLVSLSYRPT